MMKRLLFSLLLVAACSSVFANITQNRWRWRNNDGTETTATWKAGQDTAIVINDMSSIRLRAEIYNDTNDSTRAIGQNLQYAASASGPWYDITDATPLNAFVLAGDGYYIKNGEATTRQLNNGKYPAFEPGSIVTGTNVVSNIIKFNRSREYEWHIKPTAYTKPNTTYYFKAAGTQEGSKGSAKLTTGSFFTADKVILTNSGFETNQQVWTPSNSNGSVSTMVVNSTANQFHFGAKALKITVTDKGTENSVKLTHSAFTGSSERTYLLRFWAISDLNNALLRLNVKSSAGDSFCTYKISKRFDANANGWQAYEYAFKVPDGPVTVEMTFNSNTTYYLDDVEIYDDTHPNIDVKTQYKWQYNHPNPGWISGDNDTSVKLPDGRVAWIFSDSFMGDVDPHSNIITGNNRIINNLVVVEDTTGHFTYAIRGTPGNSQSLFEPINGHVLWNNGAVVEGNQLKVVLQEVSGLNTVGTHIGTLSLPELQVVGTKPAYRDINAILQDGGYNYIYYGEAPGTFERYTKVARVKIGSLDDLTPWEYYTNNNTWSTTGENNAKRLISTAVASNVIKLGAGSYVMNAVPNLSGEIAVWFAATPQGPWINRTTIYNTPGREAILSYFGHIDAGSGKDGVYTFTYSSYPFIEGDAVEMQRADKGVYTIHYAKANLLELSPFAPKKQPDSLTSYSFTSVGKNVILKWTTALTSHDHFEIELSRDLVSWTNVATVAGGSGNSFEAQFSNPAPGDNYYRMKLFDVDKNMTTTQTIKYYAKPTAVPVSFTATAVGNRVRLNFRTSTEILNPGFKIGRSAVNSTEVSNWTKITDVEGSGTSFSPKNYEVYDESPLNGMNYYVLAYFEAGKEVYSKSHSAEIVSTFTTTSAMAFDVYPNPAKGNVQFALKGYKGSEITATLTNMFGKVLGRETFRVNGNENYTLRARPAAGTYIVNLSGAGLAKSAKVILQ
ncbi:MAG: T9SS type A sorting domain-containing protein [Mucilaginibacter sp.]